jgi:phosphohistidine phosphatase
LSLKYFVVVRKIILVRHGESADKQAGQTDFDRVLTERGKISIHRLSEYFKQENVFPDVIISSTAQRTKQTAFLIADGINFPPASIQFDGLLYNGTDTDYLSALKNSNDVTMIIGHNPTISFIIGKITENYSVALSAGQSVLLEIEGKSEVIFKGRLIKLIGPFLK